jgi:predicted short-subunit dehydrogenase-like oxidoreductase (DUF2520 family)
MMDVSIIGAGRLGTSLACALLKKGFRIKALSCKTNSSARESRQIIGEGKASIDNIQTARNAELIIICLPDEEIAKVARELAASDIDWSKKFVFHCSGLLSSKILDPLKAKGALTASLHPIQSFSQKRTAPGHFKNIYFGLQAKDKPFYHAACSTASNFLVVLLDMAASLLKQTGLEEEQALQILIPLVQGTLDNVKKFNIGTSLTGPVMRGDLKSIKKHLEAMRTFPGYYEIYRRMAAQALEIAKRKKRGSSQKIKALRNLLEEK